MVKLAKAIRRYQKRTVRIPRFFNPPRSHEKSETTPSGVPIAIRFGNGFKAGMLLIAVTALAALLRFGEIGAIPPGLTNDEAGTIYNAYSIWKTGRDSQGVNFPVAVELDDSYASVSVYAAAPFVGIFGLSPAAGRLAGSFAGTLSVVFLYVLARRLTKSRFAGLAAALFLAASPWHIFVSRSAGDPVFAVLLYILSLNLFLSSVGGSGLFTLLSMIVGFVAFQSFYLTKIVYVFFYPMAILLYWVRLKNIQKLTVVIAFAATCISFFYVRSYTDVAGKNILIEGEIEHAALAAQAERGIGSAPPVLQNIFSSTGTHMVRRVTERYLDNFSVNFLFLGGVAPDEGSTYGFMKYQGLFYLFQLPLAIFGIAWLLKSPGKAKYVIVCLLLASAIPSVFVRDANVLGNILLILPVIIVMSMGVIYVVRSMRSLPRIIRICITITGAGIMIWEISAFLVHYFYRYPAYAADERFVKSRDLAGFIHEKTKEYDRIVIGEAGHMFMLRYGIWAQVDPAVMMSSRIRPDLHAIGNIEFLDECPKGVYVPNPRERVLLVLPDGCSQAVTVTPVHEVSGASEPGRSIWKLYEVPARGLVITVDL